MFVLMEGTYFFIIEKEKAVYQFEALKNQMNPPFSV